MGAEKQSNLLILIIAGLLVVSFLLVGLRLIDLTDIQKIASELAPSGWRTITSAGKRVLGA